jgi:lipoprotein NlpI
LNHPLPIVVLAFLAFSATGVAAGPDSAAHPLLDLARERELDRARERKDESFGYPGATGLPEALHRREQARVPDDKECASSLGASRFSMLHIEVALARTAEGDSSGAAAEYRRAHACRPRDPDILAALAGVLFDARDFRGAREAINSSLTIEPRSVSATRLAGNLDYVEERWADAIARFRYVAASDEDRVQAGYGQLMYWLAQRRAGVARPEFITRMPGEGWPKPLMLYMRGELEERELLEPIREGDSESNSQPNTSTDERLCEALFYVGEEYRARGKPEVARDYLAALVNIKVIYFLEHGLALAEIAKLRR